MSHPIYNRTKEIYYVLNTGLRFTTRNQCIELTGLPAKDETVKTT